MPVRGQREDVYGRRLVIVESPAKAKTIRGYLGDGYEVEASVGHIRDLPKRAADIPPKYKKEKWARLGVDVENGFEPLYIVGRRQEGQGRGAEANARQRRRTPARHR